MSNQHKNLNKIEEVHTYNLDTENFIIYLQGIEEETQENYTEPGIEYRMANRLIKNLDILNSIDPNYPIILSMKTCGGFWEEGMAIYDSILAISNPISVINYTHARSMSSIIFQAANKRIMMPHSMFMFHFGDLSFEGTTKGFLSEAEITKINNRQMLDIYINAIKRSPGKMQNWSKTKIREWLISETNQKENVYLRAEEAVKLGFADEVFTSWKNVTNYTKEQLARK